MVYRISQHRQYELGRMTSQKQLARSAVLQQQLSSGVRLTKPSDDPNGHRVMLQQQSIVDRLTQQLTSVGLARNTLNAAAAHVGDAQQLLVKAKEISLQASQVTDESERSVLVRQLDSLRDQLLTIANAQMDGHFLFGGVNSSAQPFVKQADGRVEYLGSATTGTMQIGDSLPFQAYLAGSQIFQARSGGVLNIAGSTGVRAGSGTSAGTASTQLQVRHTATTYQGTSGVTPGASSAAGDTVIGPAGRHQLTITAANGTGVPTTVSLNGGTPVTFTSADRDLKVTGPNGEVVYVDLSALTAGFTGTVELTADGTLSVDGGMTEIPIEFTDNQLLVNASLGTVQYFDTTDVAQAGNAVVTTRTAGDLFQLIQNLRDDLLNVHGLSSAEQAAAFERHIGDIDTANTQLLNVIGQQSITLEHLDQLESRMGDLKLEATAILNDVQGADYSATIIQLQEQQNLLQFTFATLGQLSNMSILDFIS
ncbi:flagellar hook-associated protein FlgL [Planctomicrobium sp. SH664]|uniref:flagellar hook-associated protein FlgL n=1 Tax=Planctomicrobium sp. SH664 TaxID=3448125 RepID=UPI003F5BAC77